MSLVERSPSEQESLSALTSRTESSLSGSTEPAGYGGLILDDDSDMWSSSNEDVCSIRESVESAVAGKDGALDVHLHRSNEGTTLGPVDKQEILRQIHLRRHIDQLYEKKTQTENEVEQNKESLMACRDNLKSLHSQRIELQQRIVSLEQEGEEREGGRGTLVATGGLLRAQLERISKEIEGEEEVEKGLTEKLQTSELQLLAAVVAYSEYQERDGELREGEKHTQTAKNLQALKRMQTQARMRVNADRTRRSQEKSMENTLKMHERQTKEAIQKAQKAQKEGQEFLLKSLEQQREREAEEGRREREEMEKRMRAVLSLKKNIEGSEGSIRALQKLKEEKDRKDRILEHELRKQAILNGENPDEVLLYKKREKEFSKKKAKFEENRKQKHLEIVSKLLEEEKIKRRTEQLASKSHWKGRWPCEGTQQSHVRAKGVGQRRQKSSQQSSIVNDLHGNDEENPVISEGERRENLESSSEDEAVLDEREIDEKDFDETLAKPEIDGLWSQRAVQQVSEGEEVESASGERGRRGKGRSKLEQEMLTNVVNSLKHSVVRNQVAAGREFKVTPIREVSSFIFQLNEDLFGEIELLSQTGPFSIPIRCTTRKCIMRIMGGEGEEGGVDFGKVCVGETVKRCITLHNDGALLTDFTVTGSSTENDKEVGLGGGETDSAHTATSVTSVVSVMSEVRGDWGAVRRVKETNRPVSRSTSELPQLEVGRQPSEKVDKPDKQDSKPVKPVSLDTATVTGQSSTPDKQDTQKQVLPVKPEQAVGGDDGEVVQDDRDGGEKLAVEDGEDKEVAIVGVVTTKGSAEEEEEVVPAISVGRCQRGRLEGYSHCKVELVYSPVRAVSSSQLFTIHFSQPGVPPITIHAKGEGLNLPIYIEREEIDLKICTLDRLYQDSLTIHNRGNTALRISFNLPPEVAPHLEILPHHGLVQGSSSFSAQLKFLPLVGISADCQKYISGSEDDCLAIPVEIQVVDQVRTVPFTIQARITQSDLLFSSTHIDFGTCTIHESVVTHLDITNTSILPQEFGFIHLPECVNVQPNDGFGTLLPRETISVDVIFSASKPRDYCFELSCLTEMNRTFKISCEGKGVLPALKMSGNIVNFAATPLNSTVMARISISNPKLSRLSSPVIRGAILPQGPKAFEFLVPDGVPLSISPCVGTIGLDETLSIEFSYTPSLPHSTITAEAVRLATEATQQKKAQAAATRALTQHRDAKSTPTNEKSDKRSSSRASSRKTKKTSSASDSGRSSSQRVGGTADQTYGDGLQEKVGEGLSSEGGASSVTGDDEVKIDIPKEGSEMWQQAVVNLLDQFQNWTDQFSVPCFVSSEAPKSELDPVPYRLEDTLYVEITVPIIKPALQLISNEGNTTINFNAVATGDAVSKLVTVKNTSDSSIKLSSSPLDPHGPFDMRNSLRPLPPNTTHTIILRFSPQKGGKYYETLKLFYSDSCGMELRLVGEAVEPHVVLEPDVTRMEFGHTYVGDKTVKKLKMHNNCSLSVRYHVRLHGRTGAHKEESDFKAVNYNGQPVFDCIPFQGRIEPDNTAEVDITFIPDHQSSQFSDTLTIAINDSVNSYHTSEAVLFIKGPSWIKPLQCNPLPTFTLPLVGQAWSTTMYLLGGDSRQYPFGGEGGGMQYESMAASLTGADGHTEVVEPILILFHGEVAGEGDCEREEMRRELEIGCIRTSLAKKGAGDFIVDPFPSSNSHAKVFSLDPMKASVEAGTTKTLTITFTPPKTGATHIFEASTNVTLKGDTTRVCRLLIRAIV